MSDVGIERAPAATYQLGVSRPPLEVADLPTPEEVWGVSHIGGKELLKFAIGPSLIALGAAIGSGEWLLGPLAVSASGFKGLGWLATVAALLQAFYNVECARYVIATGEVPIVGFARVPPGRRVWIRLSLFAIFSAFVLGGWAKGAAKGLFALIEGEVPGTMTEPSVDQRPRLAEHQLRGHHARCGADRLRLPVAPVGRNLAAEPEAGVGELVLHR